MYHIDSRRAFSDGCGNSAIGAGSDISHGEYTRDARLEEEWIAVQRPATWAIRYAGKIGACEDKARIVELRFFADLTLEETADVMGISTATVKRDWQVAKIWLHHELTR